MDATIQTTSKLPIHTPPSPHKTTGHPSLSTVLVKTVFFHTIATAAITVLGNVKLLPYEIQGVTLTVPWLEACVSFFFLDLFCALALLHKLRPGTAPWFFSHDLPFNPDSLIWPKTLRLVLAKDPQLRFYMIISPIQFLFSIWVSWDYLSTWLMIVPLVSLVVPVALFVVLFITADFS